MDRLKPRGILVPISIISLIVAAGVMIALGYFLSVVGPSNTENADPSAGGILLPNLVGVHPEPADRFLFVALTLAAPLVLLGASRLAAGLKGGCRDTIPVFYVLLLFALTVCLMKGAIPEFHELLVGRWLLATLVCAAFAFVLVFLSGHAWRRVNKASIIFAMGASAILIASLRIWTINNVEYQATFTSHYEATVSSIIRIAAGGTCLADVIPQYGCYGEFLAPLLRLFGSSTISITVIFAVLQILAMWATFIFAARLLDRPASRIGCLLSLLIATGLNLTWWYADPYLQYFPLRFIFPAFSLLLAIWYQTAPGVALALGIGGFSGLALVWNFETGVAVTLSLAAFIVFGNFTAHPWRVRSEIFAAAVRLFAFAAGAAISVGLFSIYLWLKADPSLDLANFFLFQKVFYLTGFAMIPVPAFPDYWAIHIAILFCTLLLAAQWLAPKQADRDKKLELAAYLAILGAGLFAYYTGRSHPLVLRLVVWPSIVLFFFMLERCAGEIARPVDRGIIRAVTVASVTFPAFLLVQALPTLNQIVESIHHQSPKQAVVEDAAFVASHVSPGEPTAIVALNQGTLYGETGARAVLDGPSVAEMIRREDLADQTRMLVSRGPDKLFLGTELGQAAERGMLGTSIPFDLKQIEVAYALSSWGPGCRLMFFRRRPFDGTDLLASADTDIKSPCRREDP